MCPTQLSPRRPRTTSPVTRRTPATDRILREAAFVLHLARKVRADILAAPVTSR